MLFNMAIDRFKANLVPLILVGIVAAALTQVPVFIIVAVFGLGTVMAMLENPMQAASLAQNPEAVLQVVAGVMAGAFVAMIVFWLTNAVAQGSIFSAIRDANQGRTPDVSTALKEGVRLFSRFVLFSLLVGLTTLVLMVFFMIPIIGWIAALVLGLPLWAAFGYYAPYALVSEELGAMEAYGRGWRALTKAFGTSFVTGLVLLGVAIVFSIVGLIGAVLGPLSIVVSVALSGVQMAFAGVYASVTFDEKVRSLVG